MKKSRFPFTSFLNGWFRVAHSDELPPDGVKPLHYFGKDLVLFRTEDGNPHVLDAYCSHLGAHLGHGGKVKGNAIQCPFHGWCYNGEGQCMRVPYASTPDVQIPSWLVREVNGLILVYHHNQEKSPTWEIPALPEYSSPEWTPFRPLGRWKLRSHLQELSEGIVDINHFPIVHNCDAIRSETEFVDGPIWKEVFYSTPERTLNIPKTSRLISRLFNTEIQGYSEITLYGLGYGVNRLRQKAMLELNYLLQSSSTPIDEEYIDYRVDFSVKNILSPLVTRALTASVMNGVKQEIEKDLLIWEHKIYCDRPLLREGEGKIAKYRRWTRQFFPEVPAVSRGVGEQGSRGAIIGQSA